MKLICHSSSRANWGPAARTGGRGPGRERGIALVVTLILLAIITFMAIAFLVLSSSQRNAVSSTTDQNIARFASDAALNRAQMNLMGAILVTTNPFNIGLVVSTNYINPFGFTNGVSSPLNVNYDFLAGTLNTPLTAAQQLQNLTNLLYDPRPPVFITNTVSRSNDFRFYVDLNRNGRFEPTGWHPVTNSSGLVVTISNNPVISYFTGDPQWIGGLEFPDRNHSANNPFTYRYSYVVVPASQTLDINYIHNYAKNPSAAQNVMVPGSDHFFRNQGVGTWEDNFAAFLVDLNTNIWQTNSAPYNFYADPATYALANTGVAFDDALNVLQYRYGNRRNSLASVSGMFGTFGVRAFGFDYIDGYSAGPPMTNTWWPGTALADQDTTRVNFSWPGAFNANHYLTMQELFDTTKTRAFATHLQNAGLGKSSYDQNTFYRLLSQVGTDSAPEPPGKLNLNYDSVVTLNAQGLASATNFVPWEPAAFFTNAAMKLMANAGFTVGQGYTNLLVTDSLGNTHFQIQVWPTNYYSPSVHRMMQVAANIYDATTNRPFAAGAPYCPTVFRPIFRQKRIGTNNVVFIVGYSEVNDVSLATVKALQNMKELDSDPTAAASFPVLGTPAPNPSAEAMVSGIPLVVGAKKGFPSFNAYEMQTAMYVSRLLEFRRTSGDTQKPVDQTNEMYVVGITNVFGLDVWNSYSNAYPRGLQLIISAKMTAVVTNEFRTMLLSNRVVRGAVTNLNQNTWRGWTGLGDVGGSFVLPFGAANQFLFLTNSTYVPGNPGSFGPQTHIFARPSGFYVPHWYLNLNTRLVCILVDTTANPNRIVDYVNLNNWEPTIDIIGKLAEGAVCSGDPGTLGNPAEQWCTNLQFGTKGPPMGVINQINLGLGMNGTTTPNIASFSQDPYSGLDAESAVDGFRNNLMGWGPIYSKDQGKTFYKSNVFYVPFDPYSPLYLHTSWQANDPLVHYTIGDLTDLSVNPTNRVNLTGGNPPLDNVGQINRRYDPWSGGFRNSQPDFPETDMAVKDPLVTRSDAWDFPTNRFPNVGWLGRVHRGTPWQTIYLKSPNILLRKGVGGTQVQETFNSWKKWTGNPLAYINYGQVSSSIFSNYSAYADAVFSLPTNDWRILDLFTTAFNANATRGQLSVNQTNLAAWSAVLSGVNVLPDTRANGFILPAGVYNPLSPPPLVQLVNGIINARTNFPNNSYQRLGDILAAPELTVNSPYINTNNTTFVSDDVVERIPQQILGLLKGGEAPRFVVFSYGQALKPAVRSIVTSGPYFGLCTNYQITAEVATRTVVRIDGAQPIPGQPYRPRAVVESFNVLPPD